MKKQAYLLLLVPALAVTSCKPKELRVEDVKPENVVDECSCIENLAVSMTHFYTYYEENQATFKEAQELINANQTLPAELADRHNAMMKGMQENGIRVQRITEACNGFVDTGTLATPSFQSECEHTAAFKEAMAKLNSLR
jgi:hypothetical protein